MIKITGITYKNITDVDLTPEGLGAWSFSKLKMLNKCPLQFYLKYMLKAKVDAPLVVSVVTEQGKAAHEILELVVKGKSIEDAFRIIRKKYQEILPGSLWEDGAPDEKGVIHEKGGVGRSEYSITKFREKLDAFEKRNPVKRYLTELKIGVTRDWEPTGFFTNNPDKPENDVYFRGVVDLIIQLDNGDALFVDFKFGPPSVMGVRNFQEQLDTYKVLFSKGVQEYGDGQSGVFFVRDGEVVMGSMTTKQDIENTLVNRVEFSIQGAIDSVKETKFFKHKRGPHCQWCDFNDICKAGKLKEIEADSKKYFVE